MIITGHSLGAGVATVGAPWFALQWPDADIVSVTFGTEPLTLEVAITMSSGFLAYGYLSL